MADSLFALQGDGYVLMACDTNNARSVLVMKSDEDKIMVLDDFKLLGASGPPGDKEQFTNYIQKNLHLFALRNGRALSTHAAANFTRGELATFLRQSPYSVNLLLAGYDKNEGPSLYFIDYLASLQKLNFACQGYAGYFLLSVMDKYWKSGMNLEEGLRVMKICIQQLKQRFVLNSGDFIIKIVDQNGARRLD